MAFLQSWEAEYSKDGATTATMALKEWAQNERALLTSLSKNDQIHLKMNISIHIFEALAKPVLFLLKISKFVGGPSR